jgi:hypothetical protein
MALIPHKAGTASFSQMIAPLRFPSKTSEQSREGALFLTSLLKLTSPNWRVVEFGLAASFIVVPSDAPSTKQERILNAFFIGSASRHPTILWEEINIYTCDHIDGNSNKIQSTSQFSIIQWRHDLHFKHCSTSDMKSDKEFMGEKSIKHFIISPLHGSI